MRLLYIWMCHLLMSYLCRCHGSLKDNSVATIPVADRLSFVAKSAFGEKLGLNHCINLGWTCMVLLSGQMKVAGFSIAVPWFAFSTCWFILRKLIWR